MGDKVQGKVQVRAVVLADGQVGDIQVLQSLHSDLDIEAARALKQWRFTPGTYLGKPVAVVVIVDMTFTLK